MAKVKGPLFSLGATGKLGNSLVYMTWKGIDDVRKYVIPANPRSNGQITQRGYLQLALTMWHATSFNAADITAFNNWAAISAGAMSGFNRVVKEYIDAQVAGKQFVPITTLATNTVATTSFNVSATGNAGEAFTLKYGTSPTAMVNTSVVTNTAGSLTATLTPLVKDTVYYFQITSTTVSEMGRTGIMKQKTAAA